MCSNYTYRHFLIATFLLLLTSCDSQPSEHSTESSLQTISIGDKELEVELAISRESQQRGLMFRKSMPQDQGMLFIFSTPKQMTFWMRNTTLPLDIGYFTEDGVLREIYPLHPLDENSRKSARSDLLYALEMNQGWFKANGIRTGDTLDLSSLNTH